MRVAIMMAGTTGDVMPLVGLGKRLSERGHHVTLVAPPHFTHLGNQASLPFQVIPFDPHDYMNIWCRGRPLSATGLLTGMPRVAAWNRRHSLQITKSLLAVADQADVLLLHYLVAPIGHAIADSLGIPSMELHLQPGHRTGEFSTPWVGARSMGNMANRLSWRIQDTYYSNLMWGRATRWLHARSSVEHGFGSQECRQRSDRPCFHGYSPLVGPRPADWGPGQQVTGYWWPYVPSGTDLPDALRRFLDAGPPPVFVGFGSMPLADSAKLGSLAAGALRRAGLRGVIQRGWAGLSCHGNDVITIADTPHELLFPHMAAVVHHAGAGTTAAALRAGVPSVSIPVAFDQYFWARRLDRLGVAARPIPARRLTENALASALRTVMAPAYSARATVLAAQIRAEDGTAPVATALDHLSVRSIRR
ncbi:glycosyltransferase [Actinomadura fulvescens]|uniref:Glycosyltransferase n=1 Tax=Actinomadura fulvescens TaxID=46160 RepID=A0ABP6CBH1_9ACTN